MTAAPILRATHVRRTPDEAFTLFTDHIGAWWPLTSHGVFGSDSAGADFVNGRLVERSVDGRTAVWGEVLVWEPGRRLALTWRPGRAEGPASRVDVSFVADADGTRVELVHGGWEEFAERASQARSSYAGRDAWGRVLDHLADLAERADDPDDELAGLARSYDEFFAEALAGDFSAPADASGHAPGPAGHPAHDGGHPEFTAEQVVAHVAVNDDTMSAICRAVIDGAGHSDGARPPARFVNEVANDRAVLDQLVAEHDGDLAALVRTGRARAEQFRLLLGRLSQEERQVPVQAHLSSDGQVMLDEAVPWGRLAIMVQAGRHLPSHRDQLRALRHTPQPSPSH